MACCWLHERWLMGFSRLAIDGVVGPLTSRIERTQRLLMNALALGRLPARPHPRVMKEYHDASHPGFTARRIRSGCRN